MIAKGFGSKCGLTALRKNLPVFLFIESKVQLAGAIRWNERLLSYDVAGSVQVNGVTFLKGPWGADQQGVGMIEGIGRGIVVFGAGSHQDQAY